MVASYYVLGNENQPIPTHFLQFPVIVTSINLHVTMDTVSRSGRSVMDLVNVETTAMRTTVVGT